MPSNWSGPSRAPILRRLAPHRLAVRVLALEPIARRPRAIGGDLQLRDDPFEAKLARVCEHRRAVAFKVLGEPQPGAGLGEERRQRCLADHEGLAPKVLAVEIKEVEGIEEGAGVILAAAQELEGRDAVLARDDELAVDQT